MPRKRKETEVETPPEVEALPLRRRAFVQNYADPSSPTFGNATRSMVRAGAPDTPAAQVTAHRALRDDKVQAGVKAVLDACGASQGNLAALMYEYAQDRDFRVRSSSVRATEKLMQAHGMLTDSESATAQVALILPQLDSSSLRAALRGTDGEGNELPGG